MSRRVLVVIASALALLALASPARAGALDGIVSSYDHASGQWLARVIPMAQSLFAVLAALELAISAIQWGLHHTPHDQILASLVRKLLLLSFFWTLIAFFPDWVPRIFKGFEEAGRTVSGLSQVSPSAVIDEGIDLCVQFTVSSFKQGFLANALGNFLTPYLVVILFLAYVSIAAQLVIVLVESFIVVSGGALFLGFAGNRVTADFADNYILYSFHVGIRVFFLYLLTAGGGALHQSWLDTLKAGSVLPLNLRPYFQVLGGVLIYALMVWRIPHTVADHLTHGARFRLRDALAD
jgi:type IV secretion system protein TrbL